MESIRSVSTVPVFRSFHTDIPILQSDAVSLGIRERTCPAITSSRICLECDSLVEADGLEYALRHKDKCSIF